MRNKRPGNRFDEAIGGERPFGVSHPLLQQGQDCSRDLMPKRAATAAPRHARDRRSARSPRQDRPCPRCRAGTRATFTTTSSLLPAKLASSNPRCSRMPAISEVSRSSPVSRFTSLQGKTMRLSGCGTLSRNDRRARRRRRKARSRAASQVPSPGRQNAGSTPRSNR